MLDRVELKNTLGDLADRRENFDDGAVESKMVRPVVKTRIEQPSEGACRRENRADIASFVAIAHEARVCQIVGNCQAAVLLADDVVDFSAEEGIVLVYQTIFTAPNSPENNQWS